jgi:hypothetical protein
MNDQEKLQEYMRENTPKAATKKSTPPPPTPKKVRERTASSWYTRKIIGDIIGFTVVATMIAGLLYMYLDSNMEWAEERAGLVAGTLWAVLMTLNVGANLYRLNRYNAWIRGEYYKLTGWDSFFSKRSELYWVQRRYTAVKIVIKLTPDATDIHTGAVKAFTKMIVEKWDKRYEGIDWEPGYGKPKDLVSNGTTISGDISLAEVMQLVKILVGRFLPLAKLLGNKLSEVVIESNDKEELIKTKKVSRSDRD